MEGWQPSTCAQNSPSHFHACQCLLPLELLQAVTGPWLQFHSLTLADFIKVKALEYVSCFFVNHQEGPCADL